MFWPYRMVSFILNKKVATCTKAIRLLVICSMETFSFQPGSLDDVDPSLTLSIQEALLFGKPEDLDSLLDRIGGDVRVPDDLRYGLESLRYFREHYGSDTVNLSEEERQRVIRFDADWTMKLIQKLHRSAFGTVNEKFA